MNKLSTTIIIAGIFIGAAIIISQQNVATPLAQDSIKNVSLSGGKQVVEITAKGGYFPRASSAKADVETILRITTRGTFDCSSVVVIPALGYQNRLPGSGVTDIPIPPQKAGTTLRGTCGMGMYNFSIDFN